MSRLFFKDARVVRPPAREPEDIMPGTLLVAGGTILGDQGVFTPEASEIIDCGGDYLFPGLVDLHLHGGLGRDAMEGTPEAFSAILAYHASRGTTTALLSTVSSDRASLARVLETGGVYASGSGEARFEGLHLEGPYFSPVMTGAHRAAEIRAPSATETRSLMDHAAVIRRVTLAPEIPGCLDLVRELTARGIAVSAGHSNASEQEARDGFAAGITQATHLYNAMSSLRKEAGRRSAGLAETALITPGILCELIADGHHLPSSLLRLAWLAKGWAGIALVSDATAGAGLGEGSSFDLGGTSCRVESEGAWTGEGSDRRLAGSISSLIGGVRIMVERAGVPLAEAVAMASHVPARSLGISGERGSLLPGKLADIVRVGSDWEVKGVWIGGERTDA